MVGDVPADLASKAEQYVDLHLAWLSTADQVTQGVHERISLGTIKEVDFLQSRAQVIKHALLIGKGRRNEGCLRLVSLSPGTLELITSGFDFSDLNLSERLSPEVSAC